MCASNMCTIQTTGNGETIREDDKSPEIQRWKKGLARQDYLWMRAMRQYFRLCALLVFIRTLALLCSGKVQAQEAQNIELEGHFEPQRNTDWHLLAQSIICNQFGHCQKNRMHSSSCDRVILVMKVTEGNNRSQTDRRNRRCSEGTGLLLIDAFRFFFKQL